MLPYFRSMEAFFDLSLPKSWADLSDPQLLFFFRQLATDKPMAEIQTLCLCQWTNVLVRCRLYGSVHLVQHGKQQATLTLHQFVCAIAALDHLKSFPPYPIRIRTFGKARAIADDSHHKTIPLLLNAFYWFSSLKHYFARLFPHFLQPMSSWAQRCDGCPLRGQCFKGKGNRTINVNHQLKRYRKKAFGRLNS